MRKIWPFIWAAAFLASFTISWVLQAHASVWYIVVDVMLVGTSTPQELRHEANFPDKPTCEKFLGSPQFQTEVVNGQEFFKKRGVLVTFENARCHSVEAMQQKKMPDGYGRDRA